MNSRVPARSWRTLVFVCVWVCEGEGRGYGYSGWNLSSPLCEGVVSFDLQSDTPVDTLESNVAVIYGFVPVWAAQKCRVAIRSIECMSNYAPYSADGYTSFCATDCEAWLGDCTDLVNLLKSSSSAESSGGATFFESLCTGKPSTNCARAGKAALVSKDYPVCASPALVVPDNASLRSVAEKLSSIEYISGTGCAIACPNPMFTPYEYKTRRILCLAVSILAIIASIGCVRKHLKPLRLFVVLFTCCCLGISAAALTELMLNWNDNLHCSGNSAAYSKPAVCIGLSASMYWCGIYAAAVAVVQAYDIWSVITQAKDRSTSIRTWYLGIVIVEPTVLVGLALAYNQIGTEGPSDFVSIYCVFKYHTNSIGRLWFWMLYFVPTLLLLLSCAFFFLLLLRHAFRVSSDVERHTQIDNVDDPDSRCLKKMRERASAAFALLRKQIHQQKKVISFLAIYCGISYALFGLYFNIYAINYDNYYAGFAAWVQCLLEGTVYSGTSAAAFDTCGRVPSFRLQPWMIGVLEVYFSALGFVPAAVFGIFRETTNRTTRNAFVLRHFMNHQMVEPWILSWGKPWLNKTKDMELQQLPDFSTPPPSDTPTHTLYTLNPMKDSHSPTPSLRVSTG